MIDPRGIRQKIVSVQTSTGDTIVGCDCGHCSPCANHFTYKLGDETFCYHCGEIARAKETAAERDRLWIALAQADRRCVEHQEKINTLDSQCAELREIVRYIADQYEGEQRDARGFTPEKTWGTIPHWLGQKARAVIAKATGVV